MSEEKEKTVQERLNAAVEDETLRGWRLMGEAADLIDTLIRERDEAEQRGYRRGVEDAADEAEPYNYHARHAILALLEQEKAGG